LDSVWASVRDSVRDSVWDSVFGAHDAHWLAFYGYMRDELDITACDRLGGLFDLALHCGWWIPYRHVCILQHRHSELHRNAQGQLHRDGGPAVVYRDGWSIWALNGVRVPQWIAEDRDLDPKRISEIDNAQVRAEFVRKVGVERLCHALGATVIDASGSYELLLLDIGDGVPREYLKMLNPSVPELWHIEGVMPGIRNVQAALNWRNGLEMIDAPHGTDVTHQEHHTVRLPPGQYIRGIVQEWDHFAKKARQLDD